MGKVKVHAGDFTKNSDGQIAFGSITLKTAKNWLAGEAIRFNQIETVELATEDTVKRVGGTVGWGIAGAALLGPVGLLAGLLLGGRGKDVTFVATFKDGRRLMATTDSKSFTTMKAATF